MENLIVPLASLALALLGLGLITLAVLAYKQFKDYVHLHGYDVAYTTFLGYVDTVVRALEQQGLLAGWDGARKKEMAVVALRKGAGWLGLSIPDDMLDKIIEGAVQIINSEAGKFIKESELGTDMDLVREMVH